MADDDIAAYQKAAATGHRPTWTMGVKMATAATASRTPATGAPFNDPFGIFHGAPSAAAMPKPRKSGRSRTSSAAPSPPSISTATRPAREIKARYKALVKQLHPDANGGDRSSEDRLRQIIQAYHYLQVRRFLLRRRPGRPRRRLLKSDGVARRDGGPMTEAALNRPPCPT